MKREDIEFEQNMRLAQAQEQSYRDGQMQQSISMQEQEKSMVKDQLDLTEELERIENLLRGNILEKDSDGVARWVAPKDRDMIILSDHGIHLIMNTITFYINKNTLLSNYDEDTILTKMEDFATTLSDNIFMEYEKVFSYPSFADCKEILLERIEKKIELRKFAYELIGEKKDKGEIREHLLTELEGRIENEITKIKEQIIKNKLKRFENIIRCVQDAVHSTYLRALGGAERRTLRQHWNITEARGNMHTPESEGNKFNPFNWGRKR
jgi:hypothetical protein